MQPHRHTTHRHAHSEWAAGELAAAQGKTRNARTHAGSAAGCACQRADNTLWPHPVRKPDVATQGLPHGRSRLAQLALLCHRLCAMQCAAVAGKTALQGPQPLHLRRTIQEHHIKRSHNTAGHLTRPECTPLQLAQRNASGGVHCCREFGGVNRIDVVTLFCCENIAPRVTPQPLHARSVFIARSR